MCKASKHSLMYRDFIIIALSTYEHNRKFSQLESPFIGFRLSFPLPLSITSVSIRHFASTLRSKLTLHKNIRSKSTLNMPMDGLKGRHISVTYIQFSHSKASHKPKTRILLVDCFFFWSGSSECQECEVNISHAESP